MSSEALDPTCANCVFSAVHKDEKGEPAGLRCRRYPPKRDVTWAEVQHKITRQRGLQVVAETVDFPIVLEDWFCGEHKRKSIFNA